MLKINNLALIAFLILLSQCKTIDLSSYPVEGRTLFLHNFANNTFQPDFHQDVTDALRQELGRRGNFKLVSSREKAALHLYGEITVYQKEGTLYDNLRNALRFELFGAVRFKVRQNPEVTGGNGDFFLVQEEESSVIYSDQQGITEQEAVSRKRLARRLALIIARDVESAWLDLH